MPRTIAFLTALFQGWLCPYPWWVGHQANDFKLAPTPAPADWTRQDMETQGSDPWTADELRPAWEVRAVKGRPPGGASGKEPAC